MMPTAQSAYGSLHRPQETSTSAAPGPIFNYYLFARSKVGKFVLRTEDTNFERSTKKSEEALLQDLSWLGLDWDEGSGVGGDYGPCRQSERNSLYEYYAQKLLTLALYTAVFVQMRSLRE